MLNFDFPEKGLGLVSPTRFLYDFSRKMFFSYILLTDQVSLSDCLYISRYWTTSVLQLFFNQAITSKNLRLTFIFLIKFFFYMT